MRITLTFEGSRKRYEKRYLPDLHIKAPMWVRVLFWTSLAVGWVLLALPRHW